MKEQKKFEECPCCGKTNSEVTTKLDPFALEIYNEEIEMTACEECFYQRAMDI